MEILLCMIVILIVYIVVTYNSFIKKINKIEQAASSIDVYLTQRFDLIPNLVECVKGYMKYEQQTFLAITKKREEYMKSRNIKEGQELNTECNRILALSENYPELKANELFLNLQKSLTKMENQLQAARRIYNAEVNLYNNKVQMFPSKIIAVIFGFEEEDLFETENEKKENVNIIY